MFRDLGNTERLASFAIVFGLLSTTSCIRTQNTVAVEGGDKPIHIVMDINVKIDRDLDQFFSYEQPTSQPATKPTM